MTDAKKEIKKAVNKVKKRSITEKVRKISKEKKPYVRKAKKRLRKREKHIPKNQPGTGPDKVKMPGDPAKPVTLEQHKKRQQSQYFDNKLNYDEWLGYVEPNIMDEEEVFQEEEDKIKIERKFAEPSGTTKELLERYQEQTKKIPEKIMDNETLKRKDFKKMLWGRYE